MGSIRFCLIFFCLFGSFQTWGAGREPASVTRAVQALATPSRLLYNGETLISADLIQNYNQVQSERNDLNPKDFIPLNLVPSSDSNYVMTAIADKSMTTMLNQPNIRESAFGQTATRVEKSMSKELIVGSAQHVEHKFNFQLQAFQSQAQIRYEGITKAAVSYQTRSSTTAFELFERLPVLKAKEVILSHEIRPDQRVSNVNLRWDW